MEYNLIDMAARKPISFNVLDNGPIKVSGESLSVTYCGESIAVEEGKDIYLCRCGQSKNAPFCDGSHGRTGFEAEPPAADRKAVATWEGRNIRTFFNPNVCMHAGYCRPLKELRKRELEGDDAAAAEIAKVVMSCPSGALTYEAKEAEAPEPGERTDIEIVEGGEVRVQTSFSINAELGERQTPDRATLCRCGLSKNKPWCDGRHRQRKDFR